MKLRNGIISAVLVALIGVVAPLTPVRAQDSPENAKRKIKTRVEPDYPELARQLHLAGKVKVEVTIEADGHISNTKLVGGNPVLVNSAMDALKKWRFEPAPKETTEVVEFTFAAR
jgi:TonB family protein